jgi:hemolysin activation/secretion protein
MGRIYTMRESALGLGGNGGIRGYPANQFVDRMMTVFNTELRLTSFKVSALGGIDFVILGYYDVGRVAHSWEDWQAKDMHRAGGGGLRLVWQKNTIINISSGRSKYESNTNFSFNHMF